MLLQTKEGQSHLCCGTKLDGTEPKYGPVPIRFTS